MIFCCLILILDYSPPSPTCALRGNLPLHLLQAEEKPPSPKLSSVSGFPALCMLLAMCAGILHETVSAYEERALDCLDCVCENHLRVLSRSRSVHDQPNLLLVVCQVPLSAAGS